MNRSGIVISILIVGLVALLLYYSPKRQFGDQLKWQVRYGIDLDKLPYDRDFFVGYLEEATEIQSFQRLGERFSKTTVDSGRGLYLFFDRAFRPDEIETKAILDFVEQGNSALIIAEHYNSDFFKSLRGIGDAPSSHVWVNDHDSVYQFTDTLEYANTELPIDIQVFGNRNVLKDYFTIDSINLEGDFYGAAQTVLDDTSGEYVPKEILDDEVKIAHINSAFTSKHEQNSVVVNLRYGQGEIVLHKWPILFTNVQLAKPANFEYTRYLFSTLHYQNVYWDELKFQFLNNTNTGYGISDRSYFEYILKNKPLKWAFFGLIWGAVFFLLFAVKRRYNPVPILEPLTNSSKEFAKTIAQLYWLNPNHKRIAELKVQYFLRDVRDRYQIRTDLLDETFKQNLTAKSGVQFKIINRLVDSIRVVQSVDQIHEDLLKQISDSIYRIKSEWR